MSLLHGNEWSLVGLVLLVATATATRSASNNDLYSPTKAEWTCVALNAQGGSASELSLVLLPLEGSTDTIVCRMRYFPGVSEVRVEAVRSYTELLFKEYVEKRGWSHLSLQFDVQELGVPELPWR